MSIHDAYAEQVIAARDHDLAEACRRIRELESLVRDIWAAYQGKADESFHPAWEVDSALAERMTALGIEVSA